NRGCPALRHQSPYFKPSINQLPRFSLPKTLLLLLPTLGAPLSVFSSRQAPWVRRCLMAKFCPPLPLALHTSEKPPGANGRFTLLVVTGTSLWYDVRRWEESVYAAGLSQCSEATVVKL
ncbi:hypothetical protein BDM02DRAFT_3119111, partial [Thelephora ganbajun]